MGKEKREKGDLSMGEMKDNEIASFKSQSADSVSHE